MLSFNIASSTISKHPVQTNQYQIFTKIFLQVETNCKIKLKLFQTEHSKINTCKLTSPEAKQNQSKQKKTYLEQFLAHCFFYQFSLATQLETRLNKITQKSKETCEQA